MMKARAACLCGCLMGLVVSAGASEPIVPDQGKPVYECHRAEGIVVDGKLDEAAWQKAEAVTFVYPWPQQTGPRQRTVARLLWDDRRLYVGYECEDADLTATYRRQDDPVYLDDCVEVFLAPEPGKYKYYYGFEMSCRGVMYDYFYAFPELLVPQYDAKGARLKTVMDGTLNDPTDTDRGWSLEVAIPFRNLYGFMGKARPDVGEQWRLQLNRWDGSGEKRALSEWTPSGLEVPHPHRPEGFGGLRFAE